MPTYLDNDWVYDSALVKGYKEKYSNHNMRPRNAMLLKRYKKTTSTEGQEHIKRLLIENNLPLAMHIALRYRRSFVNEHKSVDDLFQEGCIGLTRAVMDEWDPDHNQQEFQKFISLKVTTAILAKNIAKNIDNENKRVTFDESEHTAEDCPVPDREFLQWLIAIMPNCPERDKEIFSLFWFGSNEKYILPGNAEDIGFYFGMTRARIYQILNRTLRKLKKFIFRLLDRTDYITIEDFYKE